MNFPVRKVRVRPSPGDRGGQAPALRARGHHLFVGRGPVPRHATRIPTIAGDRPPRYGEKRMPLRSRGTGPRATGLRTVPCTVGRGPVPRHAPRIPTIAGDRPPRYGTGGTVFSLDDRGGQAPALRDPAVFFRRARACPSPCHLKRRALRCGCLGFRRGSFLSWRFFRRWHLALLTRRG